MVDRQLFNLCQEGAFAYVLTSRQMGKSSLMVRTAQRLDQAGIRSVIIDISEFGTQNLTAEQWYLGLLSKIKKSTAAGDQFITSARQVTFSWQWEGPTLSTDRAFEVLIWQEGQPRLGAFDAGTGSI